MSKKVMKFPTELPLSVYSSAEIDALILALGTTYLKLDCSNDPLTASLDITVAGNTLTLTGGSITDSSGNISFGNENLTTTGIITGDYLATPHYTLPHVDGALHEILATDGAGNVAWHGIGVLETDPLSLHLDQTVHQHVVNGAPRFDGGAALDTPAIVLRSGHRLVFDGS